MSSDAEQLRGLDVGRLALQFEGARDAKHERVARQRTRGVTHQHLAGFRARLEPRRDVDRIAKHGVLHASVRTDAACDGRARIDAHAHGDRRPVGVGQIESCDALADRDRTRKRSLRLVGLATSVACVLCIAQFVVLRPLHTAFAVAPEVLWLSLLNATACTVVPVLMVMMAIERIGAGLAAQVGMVGPMSTIAMGVLLLGEPMNAWVVGGTVLVLLGVYVVSRQRAAPPVAD